ncbi:hypothetical protein L3X38_045491 [Prunus dulcis]|uniref:Uncharacterized protein n=1 Tax=Prunus dulcis TaxID=3755 RepID=A0AAD4YGX1_PRUDU|nr:hypothetical protein L3X38_045491 [Prunus dulcis]
MLLSYSTKKDFLASEVQLSRLSSLSQALWVDVAHLLSSLPQALRVEVGKVTLVEISDNVPVAQLPKGNHEPCFGFRPRGRYRVRGRLIRQTIMDWTKSWDSLGLARIGLSWIKY